MATPVGGSTSESRGNDVRIRAAISRDPGAPLTVEDLELDDELLPGEVLVRVVSAGVCHSDIEMRDLPAGSPLLPKPAVLGHEGAGVVERVGSGVTRLAPGDTVVLTYHSDGECPQCAAGTEGYCHRFIKNNLRGVRIDGSVGCTDGASPVRAGYHQQSSWATYSRATERNAIKVETTLPIELLGPLGCGFLTGYGAIRNAAQPSAGSSFVAFGMGAVGLGALLAAAVAGCDPIVAVDLHEARLEIAERIGATETVNASTTTAVRALRELAPRGFDFSFEATGVPSVITDATDVLGPGGRATIVGLTMDPSVTAGIRPSTFLGNRTVHGVTMGHGDPYGTIRELVQHVETGRLPLEELVTYYDLDHVNDAIEDSASGRVFKAILRPNDNN